MRHRIPALLLLLPAVAMSCAPRPSTVEDRSRAIAAQVWSPYCAGRLLTECTTTQAAQLRERITDRLRSGDTDAEVFAWLRANYGDEVLAKPAPTGSGLAVWLVPLALVAAGAMLIVGTVRRWSRPPETTSASPPGDAAPPGDDDVWIARVREEVERDL